MPHSVLEAALDSWGVCVSVRGDSIMEPADGPGSLLGKERGNNKNKMNEIS